MRLVTVYISDQNSGCYRVRSDKAINWIPGKFLVVYGIEVSSYACNLQVQFRAVYAAAALSSHSVHSVCVVGKYSF